MGGPAQGTPSPESTPENRLDSWKEIGAYLDRDVTTVQRWEKREGMPVHRHLHDKRGSVYAVPAELDAWLKSRQLRLESEGGAQIGGQNAPASLAAERSAAAGSILSGSRLWFVLAAIAITAVLAIAYAISRGRTDRAASPKIRSIAVLPLKNMSGDPGQDYLADGMTDALIGRLSSIHDLRVISRTSVMRFKNPQVSVPEIAKELRVDAIVEGSVTREDNRVRVTAQLIRASTDEHFWSQNYDRELRDALSLESELAQTIADQVAVTVTGPERERLGAVRPIAPDVYEAYLQGLYALNRSPSKANIEESIEYFQQAIAKDPTFAPAYVNLALAYSELGSNFVGEPPEANRQKQINATQKALELDPNLPIAHILWGDAEEQDWRWADAEAEYRRALDLDPNSPYACSALAWWLLWQGHTNEALEWAERGRQLDPFGADATETGWMLFEARHYDDSVRQLRGVLTTQPNDAETLWDLGIALIDKGQPSEAIPILEKAVYLSGRSSGVLGSLIQAYAKAGRRGDALRLLAELRERRRRRFVPAGAFVSAYLGLGDKDQVFAWLDQACQEHSNTVMFLKVDAAFDPIRSDPRFVSLLRRVGLG
ncbi:MAG TPA: tetratricopeptide repeat protein [Candidatus Acidoferrum sp.]|nr:tetratricopeptide repeat protein [Candidatus Acidoferrum sp.]